MGEDEVLTAGLAHEARKLRYFEMFCPIDFHMS